MCHQKTNEIFVLTLMDWIHETYYIQLKSLNLEIWFFSKFQSSEISYDYIFRRHTHNIFTDINGFIFPSHIFQNLLSWISSTSGSNDLVQGSFLSALHSTKVDDYSRIGFKAYRVQKTKLQKRHCKFS